MIKMNKTRALAVARLIGKARRLMNNDGEHWIQGHLTVASGGGVRHCAIGGLVHAFLGRNSSEYASAVLDRIHYQERRDRAILRDATVLLAQTITGRTLTRRGTIVTPYGTWDSTCYSGDDPQFTMAEDIVVAYNDYTGTGFQQRGATTWKKVDRTFRRAEAHARKIAAA
jgi:hypothetical protein